MKTRFALLCAALAATHAARATAPAAAPCCPVEPAAVASCCAEAKPAAPLAARSLYRLDARFTDDAGRTAPLAALRGRPVVLAMFFASCEYACPLLVQDMQRIRAALPEELRQKAQLVLVSFDTQRDTPAALRAYREQRKLDAGWVLLHGEPDAVQELAMLLGVKFKQDARGQFAHSNLITVLDAEGEIVHQRAGLAGDVSAAARALALAAR